MNRTQAPAIITSDTITIPKSEKVLLDNGLPVYVIAAGEQPVVKLDFVFEAGKWYEPKNLLADFVNRMMREGVHGKTAKEVADILEFYGCNFESNVSFNTAGFQLYSLSKHLHQVLPLVFDIFTQASFAQAELDTLLNNRKQKHTERLAKNDYVTASIYRMVFSNTAGLFGDFGRNCCNRSIFHVAGRAISTVYATHCG